MGMLSYRFPHLPFTPSQVCAALPRAISSTWGGWLAGTVNMSHTGSLNKCYTHATCSVSQALMPSSELTSLSLQKSASRSSSLLSTWGNSLSGHDTSRSCSRSSAAVHGSRSTRDKSQSIRQHSCWPSCQESHPASALQVKGAWAAPPRSTQLPAVPGSSSVAAKAEWISRDVSEPQGTGSSAAVTVSLSPVDARQQQAVQLAGCAYGLNSISSAQPRMDRSAVKPLLCAWRQPDLAAHHTYVHQIHKCRT